MSSVFIETQFQVALAVAFEGPRKALGPAAETAHRVVAPGNQKQGEVDRQPAARVGAAGGRDAVEKRVPRAGAQRETAIGVAGVGIDGGAVVRQPGIGALRTEMPIEPALVGADGQALQQVAGTVRIHAGDFQTREQRGHAALRAAWHVDAAQDRAGIVVTVVLQHACGQERPEAVTEQENRRAADVARPTLYALDIVDEHIPGCVIAKKAVIGRARGRPMAAQIEAVYLDAALAECLRKSCIAAGVFRHAVHDHERRTRPGARRPPIGHQARAAPGVDLLGFVGHRWACTG